MLKNGLKDEQSCQIADVPFKIVLNYCWQYSLFRIRSKETLWDHVKYPILDMIQRIQGLLWIIWINNLLLDFGKEIQHL